MTNAERRLIKSKEADEKIDAWLNGEIEDMNGKKCEIVDEGSKEILEKFNLTVSGLVKGKKVPDVQEMVADDTSLKLFLSDLFGVDPSMIVLHNITYEGFDDVEEN